MHAERTCLRTLPADPHSCSLALAGLFGPLLFASASLSFPLAQLSFGIDGTVAIKTLEGPPVPALIHQKFKLRWVAISLHFTCLMHFFCDWHFL